jgi:F-type H+-transporting ATPase subunit b
MSALFAAFGVNWHLLLIQLVNFALLLTALTYFLYRPILNIIDARREKIAEGVRIAQLAEKRLEEAQNEGETIVGNAAREAETLVSSARLRASETGAEIVSAAESKAEALLRDAAALAEESKRRALQEGEKEIAKAAMLAAEKILRQQA